MADRMHVVLKTGGAPEPGQADQRTVYDGRVAKGMSTTFRDDQWVRTPCGKMQEKLCFALHVPDGFLVDIVQEYCEFKAAFVSGDAKETINEFLDSLRSTYIDNMPDGHEGVVFYLIQKDKRVYKGVSGPVTHRQRYV